MSWVRLDDDFASHRKVRRLSDSAFRLHVTALCWSSKYLTDGHIAAEDLPFIGTDLDDQMDPAALDRTVKELVDRSVWHEADHDCPSCPNSTSGWIIHDFLDLNPSAEQTREQRRQAAERQRRARERRRDGEYGRRGVAPAETSRRDSSVSHSTRHAEVTDSVTRQSQRPVPYPTPSPTPIEKEPPETPVGVSAPTPPKRRNAHAETPGPAFDQFWATYPRREAKGAARKAWTKAVAKAGDPRVLIAAAERYRDQPGREPQYTAHASTWLNQERWTDEPAPPTTLSGGNRSSSHIYLNPTDPNAYAAYDNTGGPHAA